MELLFCFLYIHCDMCVHRGTYFGYWILYTVWPSCHFIYVMWFIFRCITLFYSAWPCSVFCKYFYYYLFLGCMARLGFSDFQEDALLGFGLLIDRVNRSRSSGGGCSISEGSGCYSPCMWVSGFRPHGLRYGVWLSAILLRYVLLACDCAFYIGFVA